MQKVWLFMVVTVILGAVSCQYKKEQQAESQEQKDTIVASIPDSTIVGTSGDFGQSTFSLITEKGDTLELLRELPNGDPSSIAGDIDSEQRYAITYEKKDGELFLKTAINLTQLEAFAKEYKLANGAVVYNNDTLNIEVLNDTAFIAKGRSGKVWNVKKK